MRETILKRYSTGETFSLGSDVGLIGEVMEKGKGIDYLIYQLEILGKDLIPLLKKYTVKNFDVSKIIEDESYTLTSYDW